jgi:hypothetical protein
LVNTTSLIQGPSPARLSQINLDLGENLRAFITNNHHQICSCIDVMPMKKDRLQGTEPPPLSVGPTGHPLPRRTSPAHSVTLRNHRDASLRASPGSSPAADSSIVTGLPRRNSSGESHETSQSDPKKWFDQSNQNPTAIFDNNAMDGG